MVFIANTFGIPWLDVITPISERNQDLLFVDYIHPSREGHEFIAELLFRKMVALEWI